MLVSLGNGYDKSVIQILMNVLVQTHVAEVHAQTMMMGPFMNVTALLEI